jgi:hypothetical protein
MAEIALPSKPLSTVRGCSRPLDLSAVDPGQDWRTSDALLQVMMLNQQPTNARSIKVPSPSEHTSLWFRVGAFHTEWYSFIVLITPTSRHLLRLCINSYPSFEAIRHCLRHSIVQHIKAPPSIMAPSRLFDA